MWVAFSTGSLAAMSPFQLPPPPGLLAFEINLRPVSLQSSSKLKREVKRQVGEIVEAADYLLSGEVEVGITWILHERERYYGVHSPDIDNILKPLIDAISGPRALLVNDCQVQSVRCHWIDWSSDDHKVQFELRFSPDDWIPKSHLVWVEVKNKLCMPLNTDIPVVGQHLLLESWSKMFSAREEIVSLTNSYSAGKYMMPVQMPFHRARLRGYNIVSLKEMKSSLNSLLTGSTENDG